MRVGVRGMLAAVGMFYVSHAAIPQVNVLRHLQLGDHAPDFAARDLEGKMRVRSELMGGKGALLFFWATWSPRSLKGLVVADELFERYAGDGLSVVAINVEGQRYDENELESIKGIVNQRELKIHVLVDHGLKVFSDYGVIAVPSSVLLDPEGRFVYALDGFRTGAEDELETAVRSLLGLEVAERAPVMASPTMNPAALRYFNMGKLLYRKGFPEKALGSFERAAARDSTAAVVQLWIGRTKMTLGDYDGTLKYLDKAVRGGSYLDLAYVLRAEVDLEMGRPEDALSDAYKALEIHPDYSRALWAVGRAKLAAGDFKGAAEALRAARRINPLAPAPYYYLGEIYLGEGREEDAMAEFRRGLEVALGLDFGSAGAPSIRQSNGGTEGD